MDLSEAADLCLWLDVSSLPCEEGQTKPTVPHPPASSSSESHGRRSPSSTTAARTTALLNRIDSAGFDNPRMPSMYSDSQGALIAAAAAAAKKSSDYDEDEDGEDDEEKNSEDRDSQDSNVILDQGEQRAIDWFHAKLQLWMRKALRRQRLKRFLDAAGTVKRPSLTILRGDKLLHIFNDQGLLGIIRSLQLRYYFPGEAIIYSGCEEDEGFVMHEGTADVVAGHTTVFTLTSNSVFGMAGMISGEPRSANVIARSECLVWSVHRKDLGSGCGESEVNEAIRIIQDLQENNIRKAHEQRLTPAALAIFPLLKDVSQTTLSKLLRDSRSRMYRAGHIMVSHSTATGQHAVRLYVLKGQLRIYLQPGYSSLRDRSALLEEKLSQLVDQPVKRIRLVQRYASIDSLGSGGGSPGVTPTPGSAASNPTTATTSPPSRFAVSSATNPSLLGGSSSGNPHARTSSDVDPESGGSVASASLGTERIHIADVTAPLLLNVVTAFLHDPTPFIVESVNGCDALQLTNELLKAQDIVDLGTMRQNAYNTHAAFMPRPSKQELGVALFKGCEALVNLPQTSKLIKHLDALPVRPYVHIHKDTLQFEPMSDLKASIIISGEVEKVPAQVQPWIWPSFPLVFLGSVNKRIAAVTDVCAFQIKRSDLIHWVCRTLDQDDDLIAFFVGVMTEFSRTTEQKHSVFSEFGLEEMSPLAPSPPKVSPSRNRDTTLGIGNSSFAGSSTTHPLRIVVKSSTGNYIDDLLRRLRNAELAAKKTMNMTVPEESLKTPFTPITTTNHSFATTSSRSGMSSASHHHRSLVVPASSTSVHVMASSSTLSVNRSNAGSRPSPLDTGLPPKGTHKNRHRHDSDDSLIRLQDMPTGGSDSCDSFSEPRHSSVYSVSSRDGDTDGAPRRVNAKREDKKMRK